MPANRQIEWDDIGLGCATLVGMGRKTPLSAEEIDTWLGDALDAGIKHLDAAVLYRAHRPIGLSKRWRALEQSDRRMYTKFVRTLIPRTARDEEFEPAGVLSGAQPEYAGSTDDFDFSFMGCRHQMEVIRYELGLTEVPIEGLAIHDLGHYVVHSGERPAETELWQTGYDWSKFDWDALNNGPVRAFEWHKPEHVTEAGLAEKYADSVIEPARHCPIFTYAMTTLCNPLLSTGFMDLIEFAQELQAGGRAFTLDLGGIYSGRLFVTTEDPRIHLATPLDDRPVFNYDAATDRVLNRAAEMYTIAQKHGVTMQQLACAFAGEAKVAYPNVIRRIVLASKGIDRIKETVELLRTVSVPAQCWEELIAAKLVDDRWGSVLVKE
jgi:aryl-alcohol dehydrogenase-like predicted oxidoreductase